MPRFLLPPPHVHQALPAPSWTRPVHLHSAKLPANPLSTLCSLCGWWSWHCLSSPVSISYGRVQEPIQDQARRTFLSSQAYVLPQLVCCVTLCTRLPSKAGALGILTGLCWNLQWAQGQRWRLKLRLLASTKQRTAGYSCQLHIHACTKHWQHPRLRPAHYGGRMLSSLI